MYSHFFFVEKFQVCFRYFWNSQLEMLLIPNALCWSSQKCNCACALLAEVQLRLRVTRRSWQKLFAGKNFVKILVTAQTQLRSYSEQRAFGNSNICNCVAFWHMIIFQNGEILRGNAPQDSMFCVLSKNYQHLEKYHMHLIVNL